MKSNISRRTFLNTFGGATWGIISLSFLSHCISKKQRPNILLLMSDNHSWNHVGCYGNQVVKTPNIDRIAANGVRFTNAFCQAPSCAPARAGMLTGQDIWRLEEAANLWGIFPNKFTVYPDLLRQAGYFVGCEGKAWAPGNVEESGRIINPGGKKFESFESFLAANKAKLPWHYWISYKDPHRPYIGGSGKDAGIDINKINVPAYLPDNETVRNDIADYYFKVQRLDNEIGKVLEILRKSSEYENTLIIFCGDNGWQMPRGLANLYDFGTKIPLVMSWQGHISPGRVIDDFVNMNDFAPTFLEIAGIPKPKEMTAKSLTSLLFSKNSGQLEKERDCVFLARERHAFCRKKGLAYPGRAIRTRDYLYIRNYEPDRCPAGDPPLFGDVDSHSLQYPTPTKLYMLANKKDLKIKSLYELAFEKRPAEELYDLKKDPEQMQNVASENNYSKVKEKLAQRLTEYLKATIDPRETGGEIIWDKTKYYKDKDKTPHPNEEAIQKLGLKSEYSYL